MLLTHQQVFAQIRQPKQLYVESMRFKGVYFFFSPVVRTQNYWYSALRRSPCRPTRVRCWPQFFSVNTH